MSDSGLLRDLLVILGVAVLVVAALRRVGLPSIAGFILAGALVGPGALGLVSDLRQVEALAEIGVVLLLFGVGMELSLERLRRLWRPILVGGTLQVGVSIAVAMAVGLSFGLSTAAAWVVGCVVAVSSTAIVLRMLSARGELDAPHGRLTLGILVFQDLSVVPMLLIMPLVADGSGSRWEPLLALGKTVAVLAGVLVAARLVVPRLLDVVARTRQRDLFVLSVVLVCLGTAWAVQGAGMSLAIGAFLGGLVVAGSAYRTQALADLIPFREVLTSIFFVSVGMLLNPLTLLANAWPIALLVILVLIGKFLVVFTTGLIMRLPVRVAVLAGVALAQVGEFAFVIMRAADEAHLSDAYWRDNLNAAVIVSMMIAPMVLGLGPRVAAGVGKLRALTRLLDVRTPEEASAGATLRDHVIIAGYGMAGLELARALKACGVPYAILDLNANNVRAASQLGEPAYFGDVTSPEVLAHLHVGEARALVLVINDPNAAVHAVPAIRRVAPSLPIVVRARYVLDAEPLRAAGASEVVLGELESAVEVTSRVLARCKIEQSTVDEHLEAMRARYRDPAPDTVW